MLRKPITLERKTIYIALATFLLASALAIAHSSSSSRASSETRASTTDSASSSSVHSQNRLEAERITLRPTGFEPAQITRTSGRFLLAVNDRSGKENVTLLLVRVTGDLLNEVRMRERPRKHEWRQVLNLPPGRYELRDAGDPERVCQITITSN